MIFKLRLPRVKSLKKKKKGVKEGRYVGQIMRYGKYFLGTNICSASGSGRQNHLIFFITLYIYYTIYAIG